MSDLETTLRELDVDWPATPDFAGPVMARIAAPPKPSWRKRIAAFLLALVVVGGGTLAVSPAARSTVLEWLGLKSVKIERSEPRIGAGVDLGPVIELPEGTRVPQALSAPEAHDTTLPDGTKIVSLVYEGPILVQVFKARVSPFIQKTVGMGARLERVPDGYWITNAHGFAYESPSGGTFEPQRLADRTLLIERDGLLIRVEGKISKARALEIANSVKGVRPL